ncbi:MAG: hypothetical protein JWO38_2267 [Gemmataceae bacterium]|nr:hypothetical protein [Gemmataceae bacterium]
MRPVHLLLLAPILFATGCSWIVVNSGQNLGELKTRAQVHDTFGLPAATGRTKDQPFEEYFTRRKIAEPWKNIYIVMGDFSTFGLGEFIWFPHQLFLAGRRSVVGQQIRFIYDVVGNVRGIRLDGESVSWGVEPPAGIGPPAAAASPDK